VNLILSQVVIKELRSTSTQDVQVEFNMMNMLQHPNIIKPIEVIAHPLTGAQCLVMEYAPGGELFHYINKKGKLEEPEARRLFSQLVDAVEHIHSKNVIHRDIKPENLLLDSNNNLKISDFGFSSFCPLNALLKRAHADHHSMPLQRFTEVYLMMGEQQMCGQWEWFSL
jgi:serine/threonine protein kinase